jgi:hypothetical protein
VTALDGYEPLSDAVHQDPWEWYDRARRHCPVHHYTVPDELRRPPSANPLFGRQPEEFFTVVRYDDVRELASDSGLFSSRYGPGPEFAVAPNGVGMLIYADEPAHRQQRRIVGKALTPRAVADLEPAIRRTARALVDGFREAGEVDLVPALCEALPAEIFSRILGVSPDDRALFKRWTDGMVSAFGGDEEAEQHSMQIMGELAQYFLTVLAGRRAALERGETLPDDLITALMLSDYDGRTFDDTDILLAVHIMLVGGHETTIAGLANIGYLLATHPDQLKLLHEDRALIPAAVEEVLRWDAPVTGVFRTPHRDTALHGVPLPTDTKVRLVLGSANRDPEVFADPERFDIRRDPRTLRRHLAFGAGIHSCVGAALARLEMTVALETLLDTLGSWRLDPEHPPVRGDNIAVRKFTSLPIIWDRP